MVYVSTQAVRSVFIPFGVDGVTVSVYTPAYSILLVSPVYQALDAESQVTLESSPVALACVLTKTLLSVNVKVQSPLV